MIANADRSSGERYWVGVVSRSHVHRGVEGGFAQLCHGKAAPLRKMKQGDWLIYYSPKTDYSRGEPLQAFTAVGQVTDERVYEFEMAPDFVPYRRNIRFIPCREMPIRPLLGQLSFTQDNKYWGYRLRSGHFEISREDFRLIAEAMQAVPV